MTKNGVLPATLAYAIASILVGLVLALPDEAWFESLYPPRTGAPAASVALWIGHKILFALGIAIVYVWARPALRGPGWRRGLIVALAGAITTFATYVGQWPVLGGSIALWAWWSVYAVVCAVVSGAVMGTVSDRFLSRPK